MVTIYLLGQNNKNIIWFSCGAASAVMVRIMSKQLPDCQIVYCDTKSEDIDNVRFLKDIENWVNRKFEIISSKKYNSVSDVINKTNYIRGRFGARCTTELKRNVRLEYCDVNDIHYWGFTFDEAKRIEDWKLRNYQIINNFPLSEYGITKKMCYAIINEAGIELPRMYKLGLNHNNCIGCVKSGSPKYWNIIRKHYPDVFKERAEQSRRLNFAMCTKTINKVKTFIFLDELDPMDIEDTDGDISCDIGCQAIYNSIIK